MLYCLHVPLDNYIKYSTSNSLAQALGFKVIKPFANYFGGLAGLICECNYSLEDCECNYSLEELSKKFESVLGHKIKLYNYASNKIINNRIGVVAGGGNDFPIHSELIKEKVFTLVTGITALNDFSKSVHENAIKNKINLLGGTHYSIEKFACIKMIDYFKALNLPCEFIPGKPDFNDL